MPGWGEAHAATGARSGRELIETVSDAVRLCRNLRYENPSTFDDVTPEELETVARGLRAVAYSCTEGARLLDRVAAGRRGEGHPVTTTSREVVEVRDGDHLVARIVDVEEPGE